MRFRVSDQEFALQKADLAVCFAYEKDKSPRALGSASLKRELAQQMKAEGFLGRAGDLLVWSVNGRYAARRYLVIGLGSADPESSLAIRQGAARAAREAARFSAKSLALQLPAGNGEQARAAVEGAVLGAYRFERYLTDSARKRTALGSVVLCTDKLSAGLRKSVRVGEIGARGASLTRDLVNEAPSRLTPSVMARLAAKEAKARGLRCKVLGSTELRRLGMHALLSVSRGTREQPRVVHLTYKPKKARAGHKVVLVGKGVTFDSGGLNLKLGDGMLEMKADMAGAGAVLGAMSALAEIDCKVEVHALLGLVENMTGGAAYKPGDILDTYLGKTVEVGNTDAEGRLVLCDLLAYAAAKLSPTCMVDLATLTGACVVALGPSATGLFTRDEALRAELSRAGDAAGEKIWPLPMYDEYLTMIQKGPADLRNVGGRYGGAITAALFLGEFVPKGLPWAHLDIAGPAFNPTEQATLPTGATGAGVLTLLRWIESL